MATIGGAPGRLVPREHDDEAGKRPAPARPPSCTSIHGRSLSRPAQPRLRRHGVVPGRTRGQPASVIASGFYEFTGASYPKTKHRFTLKDAACMAIGGIWRPGNDNQPDAFAIASIHNRQVLVLRIAERGSRAPRTPGGADAGLGCEGCLRDIKILFAGTIACSAGVRAVGRIARARPGCTIARRAGARRPGGHRANSHRTIASRAKALLLAAYCGVAVIGVGSVSSRLNSSCRLPCGRSGLCHRCPGESKDNHRCINELHVFPFRRLFCNRNVIGRWLVSGGEICKDGVFSFTEQSPALGQLNQRHAFVRLPSSGHRRAKFRLYFTWPGSASLTAQPVHRIDQQQSRSALSQVLAVHVHDAAGGADNP